MAPPAAPPLAKAVMGKIALIGAALAVLLLAAGASFERISPLHQPVSLPLQCSTDAGCRMPGATARNLLGSNLFGHINR